MKLLKTLLTCSTLAALIASTHAASTEITAWGVGYGYTGPLHVMTVNAQIQGEFYVETDWDDVIRSSEIIGYDDDGEPIYGEVLTYINPRNIYQVTLPDEWLGRSISVSWDGAQTWTSFKPFITDGAPISFQSDSGGPGDPVTNPFGSVTLLANNLLIGRWWDDPTKVLFTMGTWDTGDPGWRAIGMDFMASSQDAYWRWMHPAADGLHVEMAMTLDYLHRLTLRKREGSSAQAIIIDPDSGQITINGNPLLSNTAQGASRSVTLGYHTTLQGYGQTVIGVNNIPVGNANSATDPTSEVFVVGGGTYGEPNIPAQSTNAFTVKRNGDTTVTGALLVGKGNALGVRANDSGQVVLGTYNNKNTNDAGIDHTRGSLIVGNGTSATAGSNALRVTENGTILIQQQGDISMGNFTSGPKP